MTIVSWSGTDCIPIRTSWGQRQLCDSGQQPASEAVVEHNKGAGDLVGVDPMMGHADWISCQVFLNGSPQNGLQRHGGRRDRRKLPEGPVMKEGTLLAGSSTLRVRRYARSTSTSRTTYEHRPADPAQPVGADRQGQSQESAVGYACGHQV